MCVRVRGSSAVGPAAARAQSTHPNSSSADWPPSLARWRISQSLIALGARVVPAPSLRESQCAALSPPPPEEFPGPLSKPASHRAALTLLEPPSIYKLARPCYRCSDTPVPVPISPKCAPRSSTGTAAAIRLSKRPLAPPPGPLPAASSTPRTSTTAAIVTSATNNTYRASPSPPPPPIVNPSAQKHQRRPVTPLEIWSHHQHASLESWPCPSSALRKVPPARRRCSAPLSVSGAQALLFLIPTAKQTPNPPNADPPLALSRRTTSPTKASRPLS